MHQCDSVALLLNQRFTNVQDTFLQLCVVAEEGLPVMEYNSIANLPSLEGAI